MEKCLGTEEIKSEEEMARIEKMEEESGRDCYNFEGGYSKKLKDGSIIIAFGKNAEDTVAKF